MWIVAPAMVKKVEPVGSPPAISFLMALISMPSKTPSVMATVMVPVTSSNPNARTAAENPDLAVCGALTINGVFDSFSAASYSSMEEAAFHFYCDNSEKNLKLAVDAAGQAQAAVEPGLTQTHVLTVQAAVHAQAAEAPDVNSSTQLVVADSTLAQSAGAPVLSQVHVLAVQDGLHAHAVDAPALTQAHVLAVQDAVQAVTSDEAVFPPDVIPASSVAAVVAVGSSVSTVRGG